MQEGGYVQVIYWLLSHIQKDQNVEKSCYETNKKTETGGDFSVDLFSRTAVGVSYRAYRD